MWLPNIIAVTGQSLELSEIMLCSLSCRNKERDSLVYFVHVWTRLPTWLLASLCSCVSVKIYELIVAVIRSYTLGSASSGAVMLDVWHRAGLKGGYWLQGADQSSVNIYCQVFKKRNWFEEYSTCWGCALREGFKFYLHRRTPKVLFITCVNISFKDTGHYW